MFHHPDSLQSNGNGGSASQTLHDRPMGCPGGRMVSYPRKWGLTRTVELASDDMRWPIEDCAYSVGRQGWD